MTEIEWCKRCGARHEKRNVCADTIDASGAERLGWRVQALSDSGTETFGVLIAECETRWRARVLTFPNMLWSVPGGRCTMKFVGVTARQVESEAKRFVMEVCRRRGLTMTEVPVKEQLRAVKSEGIGMDAGRSTRSLHVLRVLFGTDRARQEAQTNDVSAHGLFIATDRHVPTGSKIKMLVDIDNYTIPLVGTVRWARSRPDGGRPPGLGVELHSPPAMYVKYTDRLRKQLLSEQAKSPEKEEPVAVN